MQLGILAIHVKDRWLEQPLNSETSFYYILKNFGRSSMYKFIDKIN